MRRKILISFSIISVLILGLIAILFFYSERSQNFIMESLNLKTFLNEKVKNIVSKKINDKNINVNIETIKFLKPDWPNIVKIELNKVNIHSFKQKRKSKIKFIELGFSYDKLFANFFLNENDIQPSYIRFQDLTLNARMEKDKFIPGPLIKIFSLINENNFQVQHTLKMTLESKIVIGKINFLLSHKSDLLKEEFLEIKCENVLITRTINKSRSLDMDCEKGKNSYFSVRANLTEEFNNVSGKIQNINSNIILNYLNENLNFLKKGVNSQLNGSYNIKTKKDLSILSFNFLSDDSILTLDKNEDEEILKTKISGLFSWENKKNILEFSDVILGEQIHAFGKIDLITKTGSSFFTIKKLSVEDAKIYLKKFSNLYHIDFTSDIKKISKNFKGGNLKNLSLKIKFSLIEEFTLEEIDGLTNLSNVRFDYNNTIFKKLLCTISGNVNFRINPLELDDSSFQVNLKAHNGFILANDNKLQYKFSKALISGKLYDNNLIISKANFFQNSDLEYVFHDVKVSNGIFRISKLEYIKEKKLQYIFNDTVINNMYVSKSFLKIKINKAFSSFINRKFDIELLGNTDLEVHLSGNLKNLNFNLKLNSNLKNSYLKIPYFDLVKKINITSSIKGEIILIRGKLAFIKNAFLSVNKKNYKVDFIDFSQKNTNLILLNKLKTPDLDIDKLILSNNAKKLNIQAVGKRIDLSKLKKSLRNKNEINKQIILDLTADLIKLNSKISLTGNLKGEIKDSSFKSIAYGKMFLGGASLIDNGKFEILVDNKVSRLNGLGLVGGAETKINLHKNFNNFPILVFDTSDGGKLLKSLGFTKNIKSGDMQIKIKFLNDEYDHYEGKIISKNFSLINAPGIINSLSVLSFSGIGSIISGEGVFFDKGQVNIKVKKQIFNFDKVYLSSESLGIAAKGKLDLQNNSINMTGSIAPIKLISKILSVVPAVGELLTGLKKEGLFAGQFNMQGSIKNPKIRLNTMSFAPGILRDLFSEDWLDNKNFFINR